MTTHNPADAVVFDEDNLIDKALFDGVTARLAWGEKLMFSLVCFEPGGVVPEHDHPHEQAGICLDGHFELIVDGQARIIRPRQMYIIPGGTPHAARALDAPCKTLDVFAPPRDEYKP
jgi:quercetin dioxygenase-like cupin family protein